MHAKMSSNSTNIINQIPVTNVNEHSMIYQYPPGDAKTLRDYLQTVVGIHTPARPLLQHAQIQSRQGMHPTSITTTSPNVCSLTHDNNSSITDTSSITHNTPVSQVEVTARAMMALNSGRSPTPKEVVWNHWC